ncbi:MAG: hypothetical protein IRY90_11570 [Actinomadura rubrobrunea]|nr:hypothetical protein [Actinomadura rubrobrunea]
MAASAVVQEPAGPRRTGTGCLEPARRLAAALADGVERVVVAATAEGNVAVARVGKEPSTC